MKVISIFVPGAVGFFRGEGPMAGLEVRGHTARAVNEASGLSTEQLTEMIETADVVQVGAFGRMFEDRAEPFQNMRGILVYDLDDDYWSWASDPGSTDPRYAKGNAAVRHAITPERLREVESWLAGVDLVTTTTPELARVLRAHGAKHVAVCPNALLRGLQRQTPRPGAIVKPIERDVPLASLSRAERLRARAALRGGPKPIRVESAGRVGWSGLISHRADLGPALEALHTVMSVDATIQCGSLGPIDFMQAHEWRSRGFKPRGYGRVITEMPDGSKSDTVPFHLFFNAIEAMNPDVAIVPLRPSGFNAAKSAITLHSWGIQGVPVVCSRSGPYAAAELEGFPARYVDHEDHHAWAREIRALIYDRAKARELGERARAWVLEHRCFPKAAEPWERAFLDACARKGVEVEPAGPLALLNDAALEINGKPVKGTGPTRAQRVADALAAKVEGVEVIDTPDGGKVIRFPDGASHGKG